MFRKLDQHDKRGPGRAALLLLLAGVANQAGAVPVLNGANGHYYDSVAVVGGINWNDAKTAAEALSFAGLQGHLVTITSLAEQTFINGSLPAATFGAPGVFGYWIGGLRGVGSSTFSWVTGEPFSFTNWNVGEPNFDLAPAGIHFFGQGSPLGKWNDATAAAHLFGGFVVEFEAPAPGSLALLGLGLAGLAARRRNAA